MPYGSYLLAISLIWRLFSNELLCTPLNQLASEHQLHPSQISQWKKQLLEQGSDIFATNPTQRQREQNDRESSLYEQMGRLNMELDWLKKKAASSR